MQVSHLVCITAGVHHRWCRPGRRYHRHPDHTGAGSALADLLALI